MVKIPYNIVRTMEKRYGIFELRAKVGTDISRVLYFFYYEGRIVLTHGFIKKTQRTPAGEIEKAKKYRRDYIERHGK